MSIYICVCVGVYIYTSLYIIDTYIYLYICGFIGFYIRLTRQVMLIPEATPSADLIMIATGTGIAPYRGFLRRLFVERTPAADAFKGLAWLFLGVATSEGLLYDDDWREVKDKCINMYMYMCACKYACMYVYIYNIYIYIYIYMCVCVYIHICIYVCVCVCV